MIPRTNETKLKPMHRRPGDFIYWDPDNEMSYLFRTKKTKELVCIGMVKRCKEINFWLTIDNKQQQWEHQ